MKGRSKEDKLNILQTLMSEAINIIPDEESAIKEVIGFRHTLISESDRGCALMSAAFMDERLTKLIKAFLIDEDNLPKGMFKFNGPFGTFSAKIDTALSMGLIPKNVHRDLHLLRKIRNDFAHVSSPIGFDDEPIASRCRELALHGRSPEARTRGKFTRSMMCILSITEVGRIDTKRRVIPPDHDITPQQEGVKKFREFLEKQGLGDIVEDIE